MRKWIAVPLIIALLLFGNTAMAKSGEGTNDDVNSLDIQTEGCGKIPPGLLNALKKVKNPKARASIQKNIDKHKQKCEDDEKEWTDQQLVSADKAALKIGFSGSDSAQSVTGPLLLPATGTKGSAITWSSNMPSVISNNGLTVVRPASVDATIILTATISLNQVTDTKTFTLIVKAASITLTDAQKVAADKAALEILFTGTDAASHVTQALATLPSTGTNGSTIFWLSGNPSVISNDGKTVIRPAAGAGDTTVLMIAIIASNSTSDTKVFQLTVNQQLTDTQKVAADKTVLDIDFGGSDALTRVTRPVDQLPAIGENGSLITWISSSPSVVSNDGKTIVRPAVDAADVTVVMTALITSNSVIDSKSFTLTVKREFTTLEKLAADKADLAITFGESDSATHVTQSISLPTSGYYGSTVVWVSNTISILSNNGTLLTRPVHGAGDATVTLTAYISNNGIGDSKIFQVIVKQLP
ncbi:MAG: immunoglobulin-like domain-containing protein [Paenibacillaceae bacterium]